MARPSEEPLALQADWIYHEGLAMAEGDEATTLTAYGLAKLLVCAQIHLKMTDKVGLFSTLLCPIEEARIMIRLAAWRRQRCGASAGGGSPTLSNNNNGSFPLPNGQLSGAPAGGDVRANIRLDVFSVMRFAFGESATTSPWKQQLCLSNRYAILTAPATQNSKLSYDGYAAPSSGMHSFPVGTGGGGGLYSPQLVRNASGIAVPTPSTLAYMARPTNETLFVNIVGAQMQSLTKAAKNVLNAMSTRRNDSLRRSGTNPALGSSTSSALSNSTTSPTLSLVTTPKVALQTLRYITLESLSDFARSIGAETTVASMDSFLASDSGEWLHPLSALGSPILFMGMARSLDNELFIRLGNQTLPLSHTSPWDRIAAMSAGWVVASRAARGAVKSWVSTADGKLAMLNAIYDFILWIGDCYLIAAADEPSSSYNNESTFLPSTSVTPNTMAIFASILASNTLSPQYKKAYWEADTYQRSKHSGAGPMNGEGGEAEDDEEAVVCNNIAATIDRQINKLKSVTSALETETDGGQPSSANAGRSLPSDDIMASPFAKFFSPLYWQKVLQLTATDAPVTRAVFWGLCELATRGRTPDGRAVSTVLPFGDPTSQTGDATNSSDMSNNGGLPSLYTAPEWTILDFLTLTTAWEVLLSGCSDGSSSGNNYGNSSLGGTGFRKGTELHRTVHFLHTKAQRVANEFYRFESPDDLAKTSGCHFIISKGLRDAHLMTASAEVHSAMVGQGQTTAILERAMRLYKDPVDRPPLSELWTANEACKDLITEANEAMGPTIVAHVPARVLGRTLRMSSELRATALVAHATEEEPALEDLGSNGHQGSSPPRVSVGGAEAQRSAEAEGSEADDRASAGGASSGGEGGGDLSIADNSSPTDTNSNPKRKYAAAPLTPAQTQILHTAVQQGSLAILRSAMAHSMITSAAIAVLRLQVLSTRSFLSTIYQGAAAVVAGSRPGAAGSATTNASSPSSMASRLTPAQPPFGAASPIPFYPIVHRSLSFEVPASASASATAATAAGGQQNAATALKRAIVEASVASETLIAANDEALWNKINEKPLRTDAALLMSPLSTRQASMLVSPTASNRGGGMVSGSLAARLLMEDVAPTASVASRKNRSLSSTPSVAASMLRLQWTYRWLMSDLRWQVIGYAVEVRDRAEKIFASMSADYNNTHANTLYSTSSAQDPPLSEGQTTAKLLQDIAKLSEDVLRKGVHSSRADSAIATLMSNRLKALANVKVGDQSRAPLSNNGRHDDDEPLLVLPEDQQSIADFAPQSQNFPPMSGSFAVSDQTVSPPVSGPYLTAQNSRVHPLPGGDFAAITQQDSFAQAPPAAALAVAAVGTPSRSQQLLNLLNSQLEEQRQLEERLAALTRTLTGALARKAELAKARCEAEDDLDAKKSRLRQFVDEYAKAKQKALAVQGQRLSERTKARVQVTAHEAAVLIGEGKQKEMARVREEWAAKTKALLAEVGAMKDPTVPTIPLKNTAEKPFIAGKHSPLPFTTKDQLALRDSVAKAEARLNKLVTKHTGRKDMVVGSYQAVGYISLYRDEETGALKAEVRHFAEPFHE